MSSGCTEKYAKKHNLMVHQENIHKNLNSLSTQTSSLRQVNYPDSGKTLQSSAPASTLGTIPAPSIPAISVASAEKDSPGQVFPTPTVSKFAIGPEIFEKNRDDIPAQTAAPSPMDIFPPFSPVSLTFGEIKSSLTLHFNLGSYASIA